jgi:hypothetical protein
MLHLTEIATLPVEEAEDTFELHRGYLFDFDQDIETHATNAPVADTLVRRFYPEDDTASESEITEAPFMRKPCGADGVRSALREPCAPLPVHEGVAGMRTYLSTGVLTLVAIMAAHRIAAHEMPATPAALQNKIDRVSSALWADRAVRGFLPRGV